MTLFIAEDAKQVADKAKKEGINHQRTITLGKIQSKAMVGETFIVLNDPYIKLFEDDYKFFEALGYKVTRPNHITDYGPMGYEWFTTFARIDW
jgi:hypothetical protein